MTVPFSEVEAYAEFCASARGQLREQATFMRLRPHMPAQGKALDAGGGLGGFAAILLEVGLEVTVVDSSAAMASAAQATIGERGRCLHVDLRELSFDPASFDLVVCNAVLEYVDDPQPILHVLGSLLRDQGVLSIECLSRYSDKHGLRDDVFGQLRRGLALDQVHKVFAEIGIQTLACAESEGRMHLVGRRGT